MLTHLQIRDFAIVEVDDAQLALLTAQVSEVQAKFNYALALAQLAGFQSQ